MKIVVHAVALWAVVSALSSCVTYKPEPPVTSLTGVETGKIYFASSSPYDFDATVKRTAEPLTIHGTLLMPGQVSGRVPAVVISHSSGGITEYREFHYARELNAMGVAAFVVDSFLPREVSSTLYKQIDVTEQMMIADAYAALNLLSTDPRIDPARIGVLGFSKGGVVAFYSAFERIHSWYEAKGLKFAAHAAFYPFCGIRMEDPHMTGAPVMLFLGEKDDYTPPELCRGYVTELNGYGNSIETHVYPEAHHAWDGQGKVSLRTAIINPAKCRMEVLNEGRTIDSKTGVGISTRGDRIDALRECADMGVHVGQNENAKAQSMSDLKGFFLKHLVGTRG